MFKKPNIVLKVNDLRVYFKTAHGIAKAVEGLNFEVSEGETLGIVGESGCGKSVSALAIMRLIPEPPGYIKSGNIYFQSKDLLDLNSKEMRKVRGNKISMVFQEPMTSLNPVYTIGNQLTEVIMLHQKLSKKDAYLKAIEILDLVKIPDSKQRIKEYPHQMSGGMRQRIMIAIALSCNPKILIADEPTTALDVTIQAQILSLINKLKERLGTAVLMITHDLGVIAETAQHVIVMYAGRAIEKASSINLFSNPLHPYTQGLLNAIPANDNIRKKYKLNDIKGMVPRLTELPLGCAFAPRCTKKMPICEKEIPNYIEVENNHKVSCWLYKDVS